MLSCKFVAFLLNNTSAGLLLNGISVFHFLSFLKSNFSLVPFWNLIKISNSLQDVTACFHKIFFWLFGIKYWPKYKKQKIMCFIFYFKTVRKRYTATSLRRRPSLRRRSSILDVWLHVLTLDWDSYRDARAVHLFFFFCKQVGSVFSLQSCLYFEVVWGSKLLNGYLVIWASNLCLQKYSNFEDSKPKFKISGFNFLLKMLLIYSWILVHCWFSS